MNVFLTILAGVSVFVIGQFILKFIIDPILEFKRVIGEIAHSLIEYADVYTSPGIRAEDLNNKIMSEFRKLSSKLQAHMHLIPAYRWCASVFFLPKLEKIIVASRGLIYLSNTVSKDRDEQGLRNHVRANEIQEALGIYIPDDVRIPNEHRD